MIYVYTCMTPDHLRKIRKTNILVLLIRDLTDAHPIESYIQALQENKQNPAIDMSPYSVGGEVARSRFITPDGLALLLQSFRISDFDFSPLIIDSDTRDRLIEVITEHHKRSPMRTDEFHLWDADAAKLEVQHLVRLHSVGLLSQSCLDRLQGIAAANS